MNRAFGGGWLLAIASLLFACSGESSAGTGSPAGGGAGQAGGAGSGTAGAGTAGTGTGGGGGSAGTGGSGGSSTPGACMAANPCGGNIVGTWQITNFCFGSLTAPMGVGTCTSGTTTIDAARAPGTITFNSDGSYSSQVTVEVDETVKLPTSCATQAQCTQLEATLTATATVSAAACSYDAASGCTCTATASETSGASGTYSVNGTNLIITTTSSGNGMPTTNVFCVSGNTLTVSGMDTNGNLSSFTATR